jgi:putative tricarboxylic transport membrane protein
LRVLATSGAEPLPTVDAPTLQESGVDLVFTNWRGVFAPPGVSDEIRQELTDLLVEMHDTEAWQEQLETNGWIDAFATGEEFATFLDEQENRVESTLKELGLA